jgi:adenine-specific DNA-methyltransferase
MRCVMDEEFGAENFVTTVIWEKADTLKMDTTNFSSRHDTILVYAAGPEFRVRRTERVERPKHYSKQDKMGRWYCTIPLKASGPDSTRAARPNMYYPMNDPDGNEVYPVRDGGTEGRWAWTRQKVASESHRIEWIKGRTGWNPYYRIYEDTGTGLPPETIWRHHEVGSNRTSKREIKVLFPNKTAFTTPKPERLLQRIIELGTSPGDIVLDCFVGSGTTAAVAHKLGRRWVAVERSEHTISTFAKPRLQRVVAGEDPGGATSVERPTSGGLPAGVMPGEAKLAAKMLEAFVNGEVFDNTGVDLDSVRALARAFRSVERTEIVHSWHGGGGFRILQVAPSMFEVDAGLVFLTEDMTNGASLKQLPLSLASGTNRSHPSVAGKDAAA